MKVTLKAVVLLFAFAVLAAILLILFPNSKIAWPLESLIERRQICSAARARVAAAGGWLKVEQACLNFITNGFDSSQHALYYSHGKRISTNSLPPIIETLQPMYLRTTSDQNGVHFLEIVLHGIGRTGTYAEPYYGILVVCTNRPDYVPTFWGGIKTIERKGDLIFEAR